MNYIALKPDIKQDKLFNKFMNEEDVLVTDEGTLIIYQSNFAPMWTRGSEPHTKILDLENELMIQRYLGSLPDDSFHMKRAGDDIDWRGSWVDHPFKDHEEVKSIEAIFKEATTGESDELISVPRAILASLIDMAHDNVNDIEQDIDNGLRQESENKDLEEKRQTIDLADTIYRDATMTPSASM